MRRIIVVAVREYQAAVRTKAFIITLLAMPLMMGGSIVVQVLMRDKVDTRDKKLAILDHTGVLYDAVAAEVRARNEEEIFKETSGGTLKQTKPRFQLERLEPTTDDRDRLLLDLSERVRAGDFFGFVVIGPDAVEPGDEPEKAGIAYYSNSPTYDDFQKWVGGPLNRQIRNLRLAGAQLDPEVVEKATRYTPVANLGLVERDAAGNITEAKATSEIQAIIVPLGLMMLMFMVIMIGASPLVHSVLEEKMQRIAEVLLGSISPFQLMLGKLLGMVGVSLTIATLYLVGAFIAVHHAGAGEFFPSHVVIWFVVFQTLAVLMFGSVFIAIGAAVSDLKESQNLMTPVMLIVVAPLFVWINVVKEPSSTMAVVLSLIPTATPMLMTLRQAVPPGIPLWQPLAGIALVLLTTLLCVVAAGRIFRVGILMQGKGPKIREMARWIIRG